MLSSRPAQVLALALSFTLAAPLPGARALEPDDAEASDGADVEQLELRNGGKIQGTIVELLPGDSLTIVSVATGESKTFVWADIARYTQRGAWVSVDAVADAPAAASEEARARPEVRGPRLHIETSRPARVQLYEITSEMVAAGGNVVVHGITYRPVCTSPCDEVIDTSSGHAYFFGGDKLSASRRFTLPTYGTVTASVKPGSRGLRVGGLILAGLGPSVLAGGVAWWIFEDISDGPPRLGGPIALVVTGGAMLAGGIAMMIVGRTRYKIREGGLGLLRPLRFG